MLPVLALPPCGHAEPASIAPLDTPGVVYSWTRVWSTPESNRLMAMVDFFDGGLRVTAPVIETDEVSIGDLVEARTGTDTPVVFVPR